MQTRSHQTEVKQSKAFSYADTINSFKAINNKIIKLEQKQRV